MRELQQKVQEEKRRAARARMTLNELVVEEV